MTPNPTPTYTHALPTERRARQRSAATHQSAQRVAAVARASWSEILHGVVLKAETALGWRLARMGWGGVLAGVGRGENRRTRS